MALTGKKRHYHWDKIQPRHFISTAKQVDFNEKTAKTIIDEMMDEVIGKLESQIPSSFPEAISVAILEGMRKQRDRFIGAGQV